MTLGALIFVTFVCGTGALDPKLVAKNFTDSLQSKTNLLWSVPLQYEKNLSEPSCGKYALSCWSTKFTLSETLLKPYINNTVDYDIIPQRRFLNLNNNPVPLDTDDSVWTTQGTTRGWNVGAQYSTKGVTISGSYSKSTHESTMKIKSLRISESCPPGHECRFETWVYHATLAGQCQRKAIIECAANLYDVCSMKQYRDPTEYFPDLNGMIVWKTRTRGPFRCEQWNLWTKTKCWSSNGPQYGSRPRADCTFRIPISEVTGKPLWTLVFIKEDHSSKPVPHATQAYPDCVFKLDTGEFYDLVSSTYAESYADAGTAAGWFSRPNDPTPVIPDDIRLSDCPARNTDREDTARSADASSRAGNFGVLTKRGVARRRKDEVKVVAGFAGFSE